MKTLVCSIVILSSIVVLTVFVALRMDKLLSNFEKSIDEQLSDEVQADINDRIKAIEKKYQNLKPFLILFIREDDIREFEIHLSDVKSSATENDRMALVSAKNRLKLHIEQLRRLSVFSIEAVL